MNKKKVYLSGRMTGMPDFNFPVFHEAAKRLRERGYEVVSPAEINPDQSMTWTDCMRADIKALCDCEAIVMMPGWEFGNGTHLELHIAHRLQMKILFLKELLA